MRTGRTIAALASAILIASCVAAQPTGSPAGEPTAVASAGSSLVPVATQPSTPSASPTVLDPDIAHAVDLRRQMGLRFDLPFVLAAAADPATSVEFLSIPTYPDEDAKLLADRADQQIAVGVIQSYASAHRDEYGGVYIDRDQHPGVVTALWTGHLDAHRAALADKLDGKFVLLRQVKYSHDELQDLSDGILNDGHLSDKFLASIPAHFFGLGVDIADNVIDLEVSSAEPTAVEQIADHLGLGDKLRVTSDGTGEMLLPRGTVKGKVLRPDGSRARATELELMWVNHDLGDCGGGDVGYGVGNDGTFEVDCQVGHRTITIEKTIDDDHRRVIGQADVLVKAGKTVKVTITLTENP